MEAPAMFIRDGDAFVATVSSQGPWNPRHANGGSVLALLGHCLDDVPSLAAMSLSRFTADLMRPVPLGTKLHVTPTVIREGKKIQIVDLDLSAEGLTCVRATALRIRDEDLRAHPGLPPDTTDVQPVTAMTPPAQSVDLLSLIPNPSGALSAIELRRAARDGTDSHATWLRLTAPVIAGEPIRATSAMAFAFDFTSLIGMGPKGEGFTMINPDVTAHVLRQPVGEWIAISGETRFDHRIARGVSDAELSDETGIFAVASTSQIVQARA